MTLQLVDEIQALADCRTDQERAEWLLTCPRLKLAKYEITIRSRLQNAGFLDGVAYLDDELSRLRAPCIDGGLPSSPKGRSLWWHMREIANAAML